MRKISIKVCGMTDAKNTAEVGKLEPEYMGFILYPGSPRYISPEKAECLMKNIDSSIVRVGVLVNEPAGKAIGIAKRGIFDMLQLHGNESPDYCAELSAYTEVIKAFNIDGMMPDDLKEYQPFCRFFLFDSRARGFGGSGEKFDHTLLKNYSLTKKYILAGGISPADAGSFRSTCPPGMVALDLNSRFEVRPGIKDIGLLKSFIEKIQEC